MWYDSSQLLSHNKIMNFVIGNRGGGKTYNAKKWCINDYKKRKKKFVWVRRYKEELNTKKLSKFFDDIRHMYPEDKLEVKGLKAYINGEEFGDFIPLSISSQFKSVPYPDVNKVIFDEFLIDKGTFRYLKNEVEVFLELYETIARMRDNVRAVFLANAISIVNPYFLYWKVKPDLRKRFTITDHIAIEFFKDTDYIDAKKQTRFGQLVSNTAYGDYSIENTFLRDDDTFIENKTPGARFMLGIKYNNTVYGFWIDYKAGYIFVNTQFDPSSYALFAVTKEDMQPNMLYINTLKTNKQIQKIVYAFQYGLIRFDNMQTKSQFYEYISFFIR